MAERTSVEQFYQWVIDGGLAGWIESVAHDEGKMRQISAIFEETKAAFGL
jgi:hypothetical protein